MGGDADLAAVAELLADPRRCAILLALDDGRALPASRLAAEAGVSASTTSSHLRRLTEGGLLRVEQHGRHRYYRLADERVGRLLETVAQLSPQAPVRSLRQSGRARALREARTCYDHLAGRLGVELMAALLHDGHLTGGDGTYDPQRADRDRPVGHGHDIDYRLTPPATTCSMTLGPARSGPCATAWTGPSNVTTSPDPWAANYSPDCSRSTGCVPTRKAGHCASPRSVTTAWRARSEQGRGGSPPEPTGPGTARKAPVSGVTGRQPWPRAPVEDPDMTRGFTYGPGSGNSASDRTGGRGVVVGRPAACAALASRWS